MRMLLPGSSRLESSGPAAPEVTKEELPTQATPIHKGGTPDPPPAGESQGPPIPASSDADKPARPPLRRPVRLNPRRFKTPSNSSARVGILPPVVDNGQESGPPRRYFSVFYAKNSNKKHKNWMDGVITIKGRRVELKDMEAKSLSQRMLPFSTDDLGSG